VLKSSYYDRNIPTKQEKKIEETWVFASHGYFGWKKCFKKKKSKTEKSFVGLSEVSKLFYNE